MHVYFHSLMNEYITISMYFLA